MAGSGAFTDWMIAAVNVAAVTIDVMAVTLIVVGTVEAFVVGLRVMVRSGDGHERRQVWLRHGRWLIAGLTFLLAADIIETTVAPSWQEIGRVGAIAVIRTFLNYFLERDLTELRRLQSSEQVPPGPTG